MNAASETAVPAWQRPAYQARALILLLLISIVSYADRIALGVLQVPLKAELGLSDTEAGALTGLAFFLPYTLLSLPMARLADHANRKYILIVTLMLWSLMTAAMGFATGFWMLFIFRMGVAIGESSVLPTAYSLIADFFRTEQRGRATAVFGLGFPIGSFVGLSGAGLVASHWGWQNAFFVIGSIGLLLAPVVALTLREPPRGGTTSDEAPPPPLGETFRLLWGLRTFRYAALANSFQTFIIVVCFTWTASFYVRVHHATLDQAAVIAGLLAGLAGGSGTLIGGLLTDKLGARDRRWQMRLPMITTALTVPTTLLQFVSPSFTLSVVAGMAAVMLANMHVPTIYVTSNGLVPPRVRAFASGVIVATSGIIGSVIGPFLTGWLSDVLHASGHSSGEALRIAVCVTLVFSLLASWLFFVASRHILAEMRATR